MGTEKVLVSYIPGRFQTCMNFLDWSEPHLLEGKGSVLGLPEFIKSKGINKVLVVTDKGLMGLHLLDPMFEKLTEAGVEYVVYDGVQPNPTIPRSKRRARCISKTAAKALLRSAAVLLWTVPRLQPQGSLNPIRPSAR